MDLLCEAYDSNSSEDEQPKPEPEPVNASFVVSPPSKRAKPDYPQPNRKQTYVHNHLPEIEAPVTGRYISKREKALMSSCSRSGAVSVTTDNPDPSPSLSSSPVIGSLSNANLRHDLLLAFRNHVSQFADQRRLSSKLSIDLNGHSKPVNTVQWSKTHAHLLASAGMDNVIYIWNVWNEEQKKSRAFKYHKAAVKDVRWSPQGQFILSCGYDCSTRLIDIEKGLEVQSFLENQAVTAIKFHPHNHNIFLSGGSKGFLKLWDMRIGKVVHEYVRHLGPILDVEFMLDGKQFISSSDVSKSNLSENSLIVWDVSREVPLSNQVYVEAYTCPCVRCHPFEPFFVAQSNGNYIAIFSTKHPFRLDKYKRYESHGVLGFPIKCGFSLDGEMLASGSSDGSIYFYSVRSSNIIKKIKAYEQPCVDVVFHPLLSNVIASCSWSGDVSVFE